MVTKKTSTEDIKKNVAKTATTKKTSTKSESKDIKKVAPKKAVSVKTSASETPVKKVAKADTDNKNVMEKTVAVKPKKEAKKVVKAQTVEIAQTYDSLAEEKGAKAVSSKSKRDIVKENAQKAEAKKFIALKEDSLKNNCACQCCAVSCSRKFFGAWIEGYAKIFDYKSRTNRYNYWAFMLLNLILLALIAIPYEISSFNDLLRGEEPSITKVAIYWGFMLVQTFVYLALTVRRLHDADFQGWKGFFRPMTFSILILLALAVVAEQNISADVSPDSLNPLWGVATLILMMINFFYVCKTFIASGFSEEGKNENAYGLPMILDDCEKRAVLRYASLYPVILVFLLGILYILGIYTYALLMKTF